MKRDDLEKLIDAAVCRYAVKRDPWTEREIAQLNLLLADLRYFEALETALAQGSDERVMDSLRFLENRSLEKSPFDQFRLALDKHDPQLLTASLNTIRQTLRL